MRRQLLHGALAAFLLSSCARDKPVPQPDAGTAPEVRDGRANVDAGPPAPPKRLFARKFVSRVRAEPRLGSPQLGYMRAGTVLTARTAKPVGHERCLRGWYEIAETGGFVCDGREVTAFDGDSLPDRQPSPAARSSALPYRYAYNRRAGTPMYKRLPTEEEALRWEDGIMPADAGVPPAVDPAPAATDAGVVDEPSGPVSLADLAGERGALVRRSLNPGFFVSLDRDFDQGRRRYWRSMSNGYIPYDRMVLVEGSLFSGSQLGPGQASLPLLFVVRKDVVTQRENERGRLVSAGALTYHERFEASAERTIGQRLYYELADGRLVRSDRVTRVERQSRPKGVAADARWIDVDLASQALVAYEGDEPVYATLVSTGRVRRSNNPMLNHETPTGRFRILSKHVSTTMDGDHAVFGPYSLEDVPYVQFFQGAFAMHGAFWHDKFGRPASHGCINLAPRDALWLFNWTSPEVPSTWHAAYPRGAARGTWLVIRGTTPRG